MFIRVFPSPYSYGHAPHGLDQARSECPFYAAQGCHEYAEKKTFRFFSQIPLHRIMPFQ